MLAEERKRLRPLIDYELEQRKGFLKRYGEFLPNNYLPSLKNVPEFVLRDSIEELPLVKDKMDDCDGKLKSASAY